jgi:hypothetical protein
MTKLSKIQKQRLMLIGLGTAMSLALLWQVVIAPTQLQLEKKQRALTDWQLRDGQNQAQMLAVLDRDYQAAAEKLRHAEATIANGDPYRWLMKTLPNFYEAEPVDLLNYDPPQTGDWPIFPRVPYRAVTFTVSGAGYYEDLGKLLMVIENTHPWIRMKRLELEPRHSADPNDDESEKLNFRLEFITMLKTNSPAVPPIPQRLTSRKAGS